MQSRFRSYLVAAGAAAGMTLAGLGVAGAQTDDSTTTPTPPAAESRPAAPDAAARPGGPGPGGRHGGPGKGMGGGIHGEFVKKNAAGTGYETIATQKGEVTEVSATSITVKSEDGFTETYVVNEDTKVAAANNGIGDVKVGDKVGVHALVADGTATARHIHVRPPAPAE